MAEKQQHRDGDFYDVKALLSSENRDFLIRNNGDRVKIDDLIGKKIVGIYFSASWCPPCTRFTPKLIEAYTELSLKNDFEVIFASSDRDEQSFNIYSSKMPWLAIPHSEPESISHLKKLFNVSGIPCLVVLDPNGKFLTGGAVRLIEEHGIEGYPFSSEKLKYLKEKEEKTKREQTLWSILVTQSRDFVISSERTQVPISDLEGNIVGLYFSFSKSTEVIEFNKALEEMYGKLKEKGESFEVVLISFDETEEDYDNVINHMPWLALPMMDSSLSKLINYFELSSLPTLVIIGSDGKTLLPNATELVKEFGLQAYPFTPEKLVEIEEIKKVKVNKKDTKEEKKEDVKNNVKEDNCEDDGNKEAPKKQASNGSS